jgi:hypothetical protein
MKKVIFTLACLSIFVAANAQDKAKAAITPVSASAQAASSAPATNPNAPAPVNANPGKFKFKEETHDFGEVPEGPTAECDFEFKNVGKSPIVISNAAGSCGCTVPKWPQEPIMPGKTAKIHVTYNTTGRPGPISKTVTITSNAETPSMVLRIAGNVKAKPVEPAPVAPEPNK